MWKTGPPLNSTPRSKGLKALDLALAPAANPDLCSQPAVTVGKEFCSLGSLFIKSSVSAVLKG